MAFSVADEIAFECFKDKIMKPSDMYNFLVKAIEDTEQYLTPSL